MSRETSPKNETFLREPNPRFEHANAELAELRRGKVFILWDKYGSTWRNSYFSPLGIRSARPDIAFCEMSPWSMDQPPTIISLEKTTGRIGDESYDKNELQRQALHATLERDGRIPVISSWFKKGTHDDTLRKFGGSILSVPAETRLHLEDKWRFNTFLNKAGVTTRHQLQHELVGSRDALSSYEHYQNLFGSQFVLQGWSKGGDGTFIISDKEDFFRAATNAKGGIRISEYCGQQYSTIYLLNLPDGDGGCETYVSMPSIKATDIPQLGISAVTGAGGDWTQPYGQYDTSEIIEDIVKIGQQAYKEFGLIGQWNLEGFLTAKGFVFNELQSRVGGGTDQDSVNQIVRGVPPFAVAHHILMMGGRASYMPDSDTFNNETVREMHTRKLPGPFYMKVRSHGDSRRILQSHGSGIYQVTTEGKLDWKRPGLSTLEANFDEGEVLLANIPQPDTVCRDGSQLCTIEGVAKRKPIFDGPHKLSSYGQLVSKAVYQMFEVV